MVNEQDYVELGLYCANICKALEQGMGKKKLDELSRSVRDAINQLRRWVQPAVGLCSSHHAPNRRTVGEIRKKVEDRSGRGKVSQFLHSRNDKDVIAAWKSDLSRLLQVFNVCSGCLCSVVTDLSLSRPSLF